MEALPICKVITYLIPVGWKGLKGESWHDLLSLDNTCLLIHSMCRESLRDNPDLSFAKQKATLESHAWEMVNVCDMEHWDRLTCYRGVTCGLHSCTMTLGDLYSPIVTLLPSKLFGDNYKLRGGWNYMESIPWRMATPWMVWHIGSLPVMLVCSTACYRKALVIRDSIGMDRSDPTIARPPFVIFSAGRINLRAFPMISEPVQG